MRFHESHSLWMAVREEVALGRAQRRASNLFSDLFLILISSGGTRDENGRSRDRHRNSPSPLSDNVGKDVRIPVT